MDDDTKSLKSDKILLNKGRQNEIGPGYYNTKDTTSHPFVKIDVLSKKFTTFGNPLAPRFEKTR